MTTRSIPARSDREAASPEPAHPIGIPRPASGPTADHDDPELALPHERDQSAGQVAAEPDPVIRQAKRDLDGGQVDTDLRGTPGVDAARRERIVNNPSTPREEISR